MRDYKIEGRVITIRVSILSGVGDGPDLARVELTPDLIKRIQELAETCRAMDLLSIEEWAPYVEWGEEDLGGEEELSYANTPTNQVSLSTLFVTRRGFRFLSLIRSNQTKFGTRLISLDVLRGL